jgi:CRP/FNR family transcriptional regulator, cyclic AMP receptor protein
VTIRDRAHHTLTTPKPNGGQTIASFAVMDGAVLTTIPLFASLAETERSRLAEVCSRVDVEAGTTLVHEGDFGYAMYAIVSGSADVTKDGSVLRSLGPGDVFGEIAILSGGRRTASVTATTAMELIAVMNRDVWRLERESPDTGAALRKTIAACLAG